MNWPVSTRWFLAAGAAAITLTIAGCAAQGATEADLKGLASDKSALQQQLAGMTPTIVVQVALAAPQLTTAQPVGWETPEAVRGRLRLLTRYDSSGPDAWDAAAHPMVFFTSEGVERGARKSGVQ